MKRISEEDKKTYSTVTKAENPSPVSQCERKYREALSTAG